MCTTTKQIRRFLSVGTPLIVVDSHDHPALKSRIVELLTDDRPLINWEVINAFSPLNPAGEAILADIDPAELKAARQGGPAAAFTLALKFPGQAVIVAENVHWAWSGPAVQQSILNLREAFKSSNRALVMLTLGATLPPDLSQSVSYLEDPLPDEQQLAEKVQYIARSAYGDASPLTEEDIRQLATELRGASPFRAEQLTAQSCTKTGIDRAKLRDHARKQINDTPGLSVETSPETFDSIGGLDAIRDFLARYFAGPRRPTVVVRIEEIEKALAGVETESSGTSGDALGTLLTAMEDNKWTGCLAYGVSGCGKSLIAKAAANQFGARAIRFDLNACKGSLVGESERQIRQAMAVLAAIGGERVFFIASMNRISSLPPELRRRFAAGTWYFDVPTKTGRADIWRICCKQFSVEYDGYDAENLTGSDIRDIVQRAYELGCTPTEAAQYHVPLCKSAPDAIRQSRSDAQGRYLDATNGGPYRDPASVTAQYERSIKMD